MCGVGVMCKCWFRALHLFLYSLAVYSPLSDSSDAALSPLVYRAPCRARVRGQRKPWIDSVALCNTAFFAR